ncbi:ABC transporter ATP-binding protein [Agromyces aerolatus]|uniref:ABC transporter ATP-binding protein n=1 Tax=Agromyces sp. LY-1074 TaxID=3074080 RepID=UPI00285B768F|nr:MULTISPECIES: ABC transporter ATP-binding protein [unclassified Agromyces]MDR5698339.1 ABC transporter ATP-binding protein [Agromyces sp. LY-1074]MDR5704633.1 ABC transporter ATP-binding protein [Agromyces sp. LY-1358]
MTDTTTPLLEVSGLEVSIPVSDGVVHALRGVSLEVRAGEVVGLIGESGGGKSMLARSVVGMLPHGAETSGTVSFRGVDVLTMDAAQLASHRGHGAAMCFQNPRAALEPLRTVRKQLADRLSAHRGLTGAPALAESRALLESVGIRDLDRVLAGYPHELSGGMAQRVMIALALACDPGILLADEPTTGLDVTLTRDALDLLRALATEQGRGVLLISHDIAAAARICDRIVVLRSGEVVESGAAEDVLTNPQDEYTRTLLAAVPDIDRPLPEPTPVAPDAPVKVELADVHVHYRGGIGRKAHHALRGVSLEVRAGETLGVVGESGSGKTTMARMLMGLVPPSSGVARVGDVDLSRMGRASRRRLSRTVQMVFQDPLGALDPRRTVLDAISEPLLPLGLDAAERGRRTADVLARTGLDDSFLTRRPHQLSGGQAQRVGIARALVAEPDVLVFDEPTSALDVTVQAQILELIRSLGASHERAQVFVSHDLATVRSFCDRVVVVYLGEIVEAGTVDEVFHRPQHPYTRALLDAAPRLGGRIVEPRAV